MPIFLGRVVGYVGVIAALMATLAGCGGRSRQFVSPPTRTPEEPMVLEQLWRLEGGFGVFDGIAADPRTGEIHASHASQGNHERWSIGFTTFDRSGRQCSSSRLGPMSGIGGGHLRIGDLDGDGISELVMFGHWGQSIFALKNGEVLWEYVQEHGVNDVQLLDLDGDGRDEVIIGYNARGGLQVLSGDGTLRWRSHEVGNVWSIAAASFGVDGEIRIFVPCKLQKVCVFDINGNMLSTISPGLNDPSPSFSLDTLLGFGYELDVRHIGVGHRGEGEPPSIVVSSLSGLALAGIGDEGQILWRHVFPDNRGARTYAPAAATDRPWLALPTWDGRILIHDVQTGERLASAAVRRPDSLTWLPADGEAPPMLIVAHDTNLTAHVVLPRADSRSE